MREARAALFDDLNAPRALGALATFITRANAELDKSRGDAANLERARDAFRCVNNVLDVIPDRVVADDTLTSWVESRLTARKQARARRDFAEADRIRDELAGRGVAIEDTPQGTTWRVE